MPDETDYRSITAQVTTTVGTILPQTGNPTPPNVSIVLKKVVYASDVGSGTVTSTVKLLQAAFGTITGTIDAATVSSASPTTRDQNDIVARVGRGQQLLAVNEVGTILVSILYKYEYGGV